ncbi:MAG: hypothetical protein ACOC0N_09665 [Chroococcales cyanobacterium]
MSLKFNIYAAIGVPELWRYRDQQLPVYQLVENQYSLSQNSLAFPLLPLGEIPHFSEQSKTLGLKQF